MLLLFLTPWADWSDLVVFFDVRSVLSMYMRMTIFSHSEMFQRGWQDVKIQLLPLYNLNRCFGVLALDGMSFESIGFLSPGSWSHDLNLKNVCPRCSDTLNLFSPNSWILLYHCYTKWLVKRQGCCRQGSNPQRSLSNTFSWPLSLLRPNLVCQYMISRLSVICKV